MASKKLPVTIYVKREQIGNEEPYLEASVTYQEFASQGDTILVGVYKLHETRRLVCEAELVR